MTRTPYLSKSLINLTKLNLTMSQISFSLIDNTSLKGREDKYETIDVNLPAVLESWKISLFSFEWLLPDGTIRSIDQLPEAEQKKYQNVIKACHDGQSLERPILGIGIMDNVEIGSRRDVLLTLLSQGVENLNVHIPVSAREDFTPYL